jgi:hypothetical protein
VVHLAKVACEREGLVGFMITDDINFYGIFSISISNKLTKTGPNTKENLQNRRKASRQSKEYKKTRKSQKYEDLCCSS